MYTSLFLGELCPCITTILPPVAGGRVGSGVRSQLTYHNLHPRVAIAHGVDERREGLDNLSGWLALLDDVVGAQVHRDDDVGWVALEPADELLGVGNVDGKEA